MDSQYNDQEKRVLSQCLSETLNQLEALKRECQEKDRRYGQILADVEHQRCQLVQQNQLLLDELEETRQRYSNLKRQELIFKAVREEEHSLPAPFEDSSTSTDDVYKLKEQEEMRRLVEQKLDIANEKVKVLQDQAKSFEDKAADYQKQINILTDYITLKENTNNERVKKLEEQLKTKGSEIKAKNEELLNLSSSLKYDYEEKTKKSRLKINVIPVTSSPLDTLSPIKHHDNQGTTISSLNDRIKTLQREKKQLEAKVEKCTNVVKQLEDYYTKEIERLNNELKLAGDSDVRAQLTTSQQKLKIALEHKDQAQKDLEDMQRNFELALEQMQRKRESEKSQGEFSQFLLVQTLEKKYENYIQDIKSSYEQRISEYQDKINFLLLKIEQGHGPMQFRNTTPGTFHSRNLQQLLAESKLTSDRVNDSFRLTGSCFSSSIKESLSRKSFKPQELSRSILERQDKTPLKNTRTPYSNMLADRTNIM